MSFPILIVSDCSTFPPDDLVERFISPELIEYLQTHPVINWKAFLWSRLILASLPLQVDPKGTKTFEFVEDFSFTPRVLGNLFSYCYIDSVENQLALALSKLPISVSIQKMDLSPEEIKRRRKTVPAQFNAWIDRQENPTTAFYYYWCAQTNIRQRDNPMIELRIADDDAIEALSLSVYLRESICFWANNNWICSVLGTVLPPLLTEERTAEKTISLLRSLPV